MNKFLSLICIGVLSVGTLGGCSETKSIDKTEKSIEISASQASENKFGEKEIKEFLLEANSWMNDWFDGSLKTTNQIIGLVDGKYIVNKIETAQIPKGKEFEKLKKHYSGDVIKGELRRLGLVYIGEELGQIQGITFSEATCVTKNSKIKLLVDEENRKIVNVQKTNVDNVDYIDPDFDLEAFGTKYELRKNEKQQWIIVNEQGYMENGDIKERCIFPKWSKIEASSKLEGYLPELITDNDKETTWVEGVEGDGIGEWIKLTSDKEFEVSNIVISNGYYKTEELYFKNNRIKKVKIDVSNEESFTQELNCSVPIPQVIQLPKPVKTNFVKITILEVEKSNKYSDTCISEVYFLTK